MNTLQSITVSAVARSIDAVLSTNEADGALNRCPTNKNRPSTSNQPDDNQNHESRQFELLPPEPFNPTWPNAGTLAAAVNEQLLAGARVNQFSFSTHFWRLAAYVHTLKDLNWPVCSSLIHHPSKAKPIAEYFYTLDTIAAAKAMRGGR